MSDLPEGIGTIVEGAALGRAAEPEAGSPGRDGKGHFHETECLNCGSALTGHYCAECGQPAHLHRTLGAFFHDLLHGVLHFEGKTWRTLPMLAFRPGRLTRDYIEGKRARFVSPMGLFLFSVFTMFAVFSIMGVSTPVNPAADMAESAHVAQAADKMNEQEAALQARLDKTEPGSAERARIETELSQLRAAHSTLSITLGEASGDKAWESGWHRLDKGLAKWRENPGLMLYKMQANSYKFSWLLIPLSLPFMWVLFFWKPGIGLYDHTVFITYSIAFMSLLFIVGSLLVALGVGQALVAGTLSFVPLIHIFAQLRGAYGLAAGAALWRTAVLIGFIGIIAVLFIIAIMLLGTIG